MAGEEHNRVERNIALLDDARKRRAEQPPVAVTDERTAAAENSFGYTLDLAGALDERRPDDPSASDADEILARYQAPETEMAEAEARSAVDGAAREANATLSGDTPGPDEVLDAISAHHQPKRSDTRRRAPQGSADLGPMAARGARSRPRSSARRGNAESARHVSRRVLIAAAVLATAIAIPLIALAGGGPRTDSGGPRHVEAAATGTRAATIQEPTPTARASDEPRSVHGTARRVKHHKASTAHHSAKTRHPRSTAADSRSDVSPASTRPVPTSPSSSTNSIESGPGGSTGSGGGGTAGSSQTSAPEQAGPTGTAAGTVGDNCNPKCS